VEVVEKSRVGLPRERIHSYSEAGVWQRKKSTREEKGIVLQTDVQGADVKGLKREEGKPAHHRSRRKIR